MMSYSCKWLSGPWGITLEPVQSLKQTDKKKTSTVYNVAVRSSAPDALFYASAPIASRCATTML